MTRTRTRARGRHVLVALITSYLAVTVAGYARADTHLSGAARGVAVSGYDPVAYFVDGHALAGRDAIALRWRGKRWQFESERNRAAFEANPRAYMPAFGGLCAVALSQGRRVRGNPQEWLVHDGRLFLFESASQRHQMEASPNAVLSAARAVWAEPRSAD